MIDVLLVLLINGCVGVPTLVLLHDDHPALEWVQLTTMPLSTLLLLEFWPVVLGVDVYVRWKARKK